MDSDGPGMGSRPPSGIDSDFASDDGAGRNRTGIVNRRKQPEPQPQHQHQHQHQPQHQPQQPHLQTQHQPQHQPQAQMQPVVQVQPPLPQPQPSPQTGRRAAPSSSLSWLTGGGQSQGSTAPPEPMAALPLGPPAPAMAVPSAHPAAVTSVQAEMPTMGDGTAIKEAVAAVEAGREAMKAERDALQEELDALKVSGATLLHAPRATGSFSSPIRGRVHSVRITPAPGWCAG